MADEKDYEQVERDVTVGKDVTTCYERWTQFERFPEFMKGVERVDRLAGGRLHWVADLGLATREWDADIVEQDPGRVIAWRADGDVRHDGRVSFQELAPNRTQVTVRMQYSPQGFTEKAAAALGVVGSRVEGDLQRFKELCEGGEPGA
jgi:uncharacterized membrane protein